MVCDTESSEKWVDPAMTRDPNTSQIRAFYKSQKVFLTGGTGYMGTLLIEKLLRSTDVDLIYIMVRKKKGKDAETRIKELLSDTIFDKVKEQSPHIETKIRAIYGDCSEPDLGMSPEDRETVINNANIIFHNAAVVKLNGELEMAYYTNVQGTQEMLKLVLQVRNLKSMVHVSTAYSYCINDRIEEKIYDSPCSNLKDIIEGRSTIIVNDIIEKSIEDGWPNSYCFTKAIAEAMIKESVGNEPVGIFRPGIVGPTYNEPLAGWISNSYGPTGIMSGIYAGIIRVFSYSSECHADVIPGDTCISAMIAAAWDVGTRQSERSSSSIPVYNFVPHKSNPLTWGEFDIVLRHEMKSLPSVKTGWAQTLYNFRCRQLAEIALHYIPALLVDIGSCILLKKPKMLKMYHKIHSFSNAVAYYALRSWEFETKNITSTWSKMNDADRHLFPMNMEDINWLTYLRSYAKGMRIHILKDPMSTLEKAKPREQSLTFVHETVKYSIILGILYIVWYFVLTMFSLIFSSL